MEEEQHREIVWDPEKCSCCRKTQHGMDPFGIFIVIIIRGEDRGEPVVRDGIFTDGKIAFLKACPTCISKVDSFWRHQHEDDAWKRLPDGPVKMLCQEIWSRKKGQLIISPNFLDKYYRREMLKQGVSEFHA